MTNLEVSWLLHEIADLLELKNENVYKIRSYRKAAKAIKNFQGDLLELSRQDKLQTIPGIGIGIAGKIAEIVETGHSEYLEKLYGETPPGLREMTKIPGLGPKSVALIYDNLGITSLEELEEAAKAKQIRKLPRMGSKTELAILRGIDFLRRAFGKTPLGTALPLAQFLKDQMEALPEVQKVEIAGSLRRYKEIVSDIDLVVATNKPEFVINVFIKNPQIKEVIEQGIFKCRVLTCLGIQVDLYAVNLDDFYTTLHYFTGSKEHINILKGIAEKTGFNIRENALYRGTQKLPVYSEEDIYTIFQMQYIPPELREGKNEISLALKNEIPRLVEKKDIQGDLHTHTNWSDGVHSIEEIVKYAQEHKYQYLAITDHSKSLKIAGGLTEERIIKQNEIIKQMNKYQSRIKIFSGAEVDILADGRLDYADDILEKLDIVVASVHTHMKQSEEEMTKRVVRALQNPHVDILAHPTGRILGRREAYKINMDEIFKVAAENNVALEINASPDRLDLSDEYVRKASELGVMIVINTDAHDPLKLDDMAYGVKVARRAGLKKENILNCLSAAEVENWLNTRAR